MSSFDASKILLGSTNTNLKDILQSNTSVQATTNQIAQRHLKRKTDSPPGQPPIDTENPDLKSISMGINAMNQGIINIQATLETHTKAFQTVGEKSTQNANAILSLQSNVTSIAQSLKNDRLEITGMDELHSVDKKDLRLAVMNKIKALGIMLEHYEVADVYIWARAIQKKERKSIVIVFTHEAFKSRVMRDKLTLKSPTAKNIFFNEILTPHNSTLMFHAKTLKREGKFHHAGSLNGRIYVKKSDDSQKIFVNNLCELKELAKLNLEEILSRMKQNHSLNNK